MHIYVDRVILELMVKLAKDKCLGTIQDVFTDTYLLLNKKKKNLKERGKNICMHICGEKCLSYSMNYFS